MSAALVQLLMLTCISVQPSIMDDKIQMVEKLCCSGKIVLISPRQCSFGCDRSVMSPAEDI